MHLLHYTRSVRLEAGGPAEGLRREIDGYLHDGHSAEVLTLDPPGDDSGGDIPVPVHHLGGDGGKYGYSKAVAGWLAANLDRFDGVIVHGLWQFQGWSALRAIKQPKPYVVFTHGMLDPWFNKTYPLKFAKKLPYWMAIERRVLRGAYRVLFTSETERDLAAKSFPFSSWTPQIVPYGTSGPPEDEQSQLTAFADACPQVAGKDFLLFAARIHEKKGCDLLIEAYGIVSRHLPLPPLVMAGPDQTGLRAKLEAQANALGIADRVFWPGMLKGDAKWGAFRACEAFILPSHQENFGIAVAEALSCGKPVLISDQVNICRQIESEGAGIVAPDTLDGTIALLERWHETSAETRTRMGEHALRSFHEHYDTQETSRAIVRLFEQANAGQP